eukprot:11547143-Ditylum_brightwellii.AAC.1
MGPWPRNLFLYGHKKGPRQFDITYAISLLSRFSAAPREGHLILVKRIFRYLKKYPKGGYAINPNPLRIDVEYKKVKVKLNFGTQYSYFREEIDPRFPKPLFEELDQNISCDVDHGHNKKTG